MTFAEPLYLVVLAVLAPLAGWLLFRAGRRRQAALGRFGDAALLARSSAIPSARRHRWRDLLLVLALGLALLALARPQLGRRAAAFSRTGRDVLVLLDLSRSMTAGDVAPSRLAAARQAALEALSASPGDRLGLIVFGGSAFLQLPLTDDQAAFRRYLEAATPDDLGDPSTDFSRALLTAATAFEHDGERGYQAVLAVSDGESQSGDLDKALARLRKDRIPVFALGIGTDAGAPVPADKDEAPERWHRDHIGRIVTSRIEEGDLRRAARETGGAYARWTGPGSARDLGQRLAQLETRTLTARKATERADRFQWPLALAFLALAGELLLAGAGSAGRPTPGRPTPGRPTPVVTLAARPRRGGAEAIRVSHPITVPNGFGPSAVPQRHREGDNGGDRGDKNDGNRRGDSLGDRGANGGRGARTGSLLLIALAAGTVGLSCAPIFGGARQGDRFYAASRWRDALAEYQAALDSRSAPDPRLRYNAGNALYRLHRYEEAARSYRDALSARTVAPPLRQRASYNLGNALVRVAEEKPGDAAPLWGAITAYEEALRLAPADSSAKWNLELALRRLGDDRTNGGSPGRSRRGDYGRGNQQDPGYEGNPESSVGAMAGGGYGAAEGESAKELDANQARQLLETIEKEQLSAHQGRAATHGSGEGADW